MCEWKPKIRNPFVIIPEGDGRSDWENFREVIHQMRAFLFSVNENTNVDNLKEFHVLNKALSSKLCWVQHHDKQKIWNNTIVCDVWGVSVPWKSVGNVLSQRM